MMLAIGMRLLGLAKMVPIWVWLVLAILGWGGWQNHKANVAAAELVDERQKISAAREQAMQASMAETARRLRAQEEANRYATEQTALSRADALAAGAALDRVQQRANQLASRAGSCDTSVASGRTTASEAARMLADLQRRADERAGLLARIADERGIAGEACQRAYEALGT